MQDRQERKAQVDREIQDQAACKANQKTRVKSNQDSKVEIRPQ